MMTNFTAQVAQVAARDPKTSGTAVLTHWYDLHNCSVVWESLADTLTHNSYVLHNRSWNGTSKRIK